jgi:glycosyltransferase involved in cell wall biosynthesis
MPVPESRSGDGDRPHVIVVRSLLTAFGGAEHAAALTAIGLKRRGYPVTFLTRPPLDVSHPYHRALRDEGIAVLAPRVWHANRGLGTAAAAARPILLPAYLIARPKPIAEAWRCVGEVTRTALMRFEEWTVLRQLDRTAAAGRRLLVHVYGQEGMAPLLTAWGTRRGVPVLYTETGEADQVYVDRFNLKWTVEIINRFPMVICCGPRVAANIREVYGYRGPIEEIPFLIEDPPDAAIAPRNPSDVALGSVGRLVEHKGHEDVIWAASVLRHEGNRVKVVIGGDGPMMPRLRQLAAQSGIEDAVTFLGRFREISDVMSQIDVFVLPSTSEAQPLAITEAMAYGKPVVSSLFGGIPDMVQDGRTGILIPPGSRDALLAALRPLVRDGDLRRRMGEEGRRSYLATRRADIVMDRIESAYRRVLTACAN